MRTEQLFPGVFLGHSASTLKIQGLYGSLQTQKLKLDANTTKNPRKTAGDSYTGVVELASNPCPTERPAQQMGASSEHS